MGQVGIYEVLGLWGWDLWIGAIYGAGISDLWVRDLRSMGQGLMCPVPPQVGQAEGSGLGGHSEAGQAQRAGAL